jgi:hypothetical protein
MHMLVGVANRTKFKYTFCNHSYLTKKVKKKHNYCFSKSQKRPASNNVIVINCITLGNCGRNVALEKLLMLYRVGK